MARKERYSRKHYEFPNETKRDAYIRAGGKCEATGKRGTKDDPLNVHHLMGISVWWHHFRDVIPAHMITSLDNAVVLSQSVHNELHRQDNLEYYEQVAQWLLYVEEQKEIPRQQEMVLFAAAGD